MRGLPWPLILVMILWLSCGSDARHHHQKLPSAVVVGTVYCDTCFQDDFSKGSHYISGATVAVECEQGSSRPSFYQEVKTDKQGKFRVPLSFSVSKHVREIEGCTVKLIKSSEPYCAVASTANSSAIQLKERKRGKHIFSAGFFTFKPLKQPMLCNQQPSITNSKLNSLQDLLSNPEIPTIPTGPNLSLPNLPPLPKLPVLPNLPSFNLIPQKPIVPSEEKRVENGEVSQPQFFFFPPIVAPPSGILPPNPLQPPPLVPNPLQPPSPLIPNPFQPPTPPSLMPPIVPQLPPLPSLPPVPGLTPTPLPPPPASSLPIPPIIPIPPVAPIIPGIPIPPASVNAKKMNP